MMRMRWIVLCVTAVALAWEPAIALEAGAAKVDITGPVGAPLNGYGARWGRDSVAVHDPLWARALYLDDGQTRLFLVNLDLCLVNRELRERVLALAPGDVPKENIILTATHTHSAQGAMIKDVPFRFVSGRFMPEVLESTARSIAQAMHEARESRRRAAIGHGEVRQQVLSANRRVPGGPIDEQIGVILVVDADGSPIAVVTNFAAHPTSVGGDDFYSYSADYIGFYYNELERLTAPGCVAMFLNGTQGNQTIGNPEGKSGWDRTESVGKLLALRAKEAINRISCGEATLRLTYAEPALPSTLASFLPSTTPLHALEINGLLINFFPGEPCVEIGLEMRRRALERGYKAQYSVGLSNDYLMYFIPRKFYADVNYESGANFFGPLIEDWFYREFTCMMSLGDPAPEPPAIPRASVAETPGGLHIVLEGAPHVLGVQRGRAFAEDIRLRSETRIRDAIAGGALLPQGGIWARVPGFVDVAPLALTMLAMGARPLLEGIPESVFEEIEGIAEGAELPFDAVWLLQNAAYFHALPDKGTLFNTPLCTMFAAVGDRGGRDDLIVGRNLDWAAMELPVVMEVRPDNGRRFIQVGFTWNAGVFTAMNDAGLVLCAERVPALREPPLKGAPIEMILREIIQNESHPDRAADRLHTCEYLRGWHVLIAGRVSETVRATRNDRASESTRELSRALVLEFGEKITQREAEDGLLLGALPETHPVETDTAVRYARVAALLADERIVGRADAIRVLADREDGRTGMARILSEFTRHSVVFEPKSRTMYVAFTDVHGELGEYAIYSLGGGTSHE